MKNIFFITFCFFFNFCINAQGYPETKKTTTTITKHKIAYQDDYTWLENMSSVEVNNWVDKQNTTTSLFFDGIKKDRDVTSSTIKEYNERTTFNMPLKKRKYFYKSYLKDKKGTPVLYCIKNLQDPPIELIDLNKTFPDKNVTLTGYYPSLNSTTLAYKYNENGSDRNEIGFVDINKSKVLGDALKNVKFSNVAWNGDRGVFYKKNSNKEYFAKDSTFQLYYHRMGSIQDQDELIFDASKNEGDISFFTSRNKLFLIEKNKDETKKSYYYTYMDNDNFKLEKFIDGEDSDFNFINYINGKIYYSSKKYNWGEVRSFNFQNRKEDQLIIPQIYMNLLVGTHFSEEYIICKYKTVDKNYIIFYDYAGVLKRKVEVPNGYNINFLNYDGETKDFYFGIVSYTQPSTTFKINIETGIEQPFYSMYNKAKPTLFPLNYFETKKITYKSRDNVDIPITIVYKKGTVLDGNNPTLLKAYGGFGVVSSSGYDTGLVYFLEKGGVYAYAEIRGGGEKGEKWHKDGMGLKKMNSFNDFIDAAEFLIKEKYTSPNKLAITGGSYGGLLVGVVMTKRPELFKVAVPEVGVFDMMTFGQYSVGRFHYDEFGNPENEADYKYLLDYSPYQNIKENINYPTTLIITSEFDDRVPPVNSYKFAAKLQNRAAQKNPIYLKTIKKSGHHGETSSYEKAVDDLAEYYSFILYHLNL